MPFCSTALALCLSVVLTGNLACQTKAAPDSKGKGSPEAIAEELATMYMLESLGGAGRSHLLGMHYREALFDPATLLFIYVSKSNPKLYFEYASTQLQAALSGNLFETLVWQSSDLQAAMNNIADSQANLEGAELALNNGFDSESAKRTIALEREFAASPHVSSLLENRKKTRDIVLGILKRKPDDLKPFLERKPNSPELMKSRQRLRALLDAARKSQ